MKHLAAASLLLVACQKDDIAVQYTVVCGRCFVEYQSADRQVSSTTVEGHWTTAVTLDHDAIPVLKARNAASSDFATVVAEYDGKRKSASTTVGGETVSAH